MTEQARRDSESTTYDSPASAHVTTEHTPSSEQMTATNPSSLLDLDVFFDAPDSSALSGLMQDSFLGLNHPTTSSDSTTWTDSTDLGEMAWSSTSIFPPISESMCTNFAVEAPPLQNMEVIEHQMTAFDDLCFPQDTFTAQNLPAVLEENMQVDDNTTAMDATTLEQSLSTFNASDDPFMGWASKRASHLFDDYGWVLSHVEAL